jgi:two-component system, NtrC family, response regulator AlgB
MTPQATVLLVDDEPNILKTVSIALESAGFLVSAFANPLDAVEAVREHTFDLAFIDLKMQPIDGMEVLGEIRKLSPDTTVVLMTAHGTIDSAVEAIKKGAFDYLQKPFEYAELRHVAERVYEHHLLQGEVRLLREELRKRVGSGEFLTRSPAVKAVLDLASQVASSTITVLVEGESGTGKELLAHFIHERSARAELPFLTVNCAALAETLLESELFGHVRGAFTGAVRDRQGRFEAADGGTMFLDEIGEIPPATQVKLLRFLQHREFERVGESVTRKVDVRVIAATNRNLEDSVKEGRFRDDLFYRLNAVRLRIPPLRERVEDIPLLVQHVLAKRGSASAVSDEALNSLKRYPWKGNVRELENVMERAILLGRGETIQMHHLPEEFQTLIGPEAGVMSLEEVERRHIIGVLRVTKDKEEAARMLGIDPATLWRKRKKYGL